MNRINLLVAACLGVGVAYGCSQSGPTASGHGESGGAGGASSSGTGAAGGDTTDGAPTIDPATIVPEMDGFYWEGTCAGNITASGKNCPLIDTSASSCPGGPWVRAGTIRTKTINVGGDAGTRYTINFEVRGILGTRCYTGGTFASAAVPDANSFNNTWYVGGTQAGDSWWNTYEIHVDPPVDNAANVYYLNAFPQSPDMCMIESTYMIKYTASFAVLGGGTISFVLHDSNCMAQQNCGPDVNATTCDVPRTIDLSDMSPPGTFTQPPTNSVGGKTYYPQWAYFDVKSVTSP
jgi:hypothetical protein